MRPTHPPLRFKEDRWLLDERLEVGERELEKERKAQAVLASKIAIMQSKLLCGRIAPCGVDIPDQPSANLPFQPQPHPDGRHCGEFPLVGEEKFEAVGSRVEQTLADLQSQSTI